MEVRSRRLMRETSPDRAKVCLRPRVKPVKKVQVIYYLSRNGHLEHPHYIEVIHLADQPLRLKDVIERLTMLRGNGMPSLYSWSCKRIYKNGYVWNDLGENDTIYPSEGAEYVLKGSELVEGCSARLQEIQITSTKKKTKQKPNKYEESREYEEDEELEYDEEKMSYSTSSTTPRSRCSRGVSTDEQLEDAQIAIKTTPNPRNDNDNSVVSVEEGGLVGRSVLLQLIACGGSAVSKAARRGAPTTAAAAVVSARGVSAMKNIERGVLCKSTDEEMIKYISENPRFGNLQAEEKEYFSGSIVESMSTEERAVVVSPVLKKSNSYNEERSAKAELEQNVEEETREKPKTTGKCIPRMSMRSSVLSKNESKK